MSYKKIAEKIFLTLAASDFFIHFGMGVFFWDQWFLWSGLIHLSALLFIAVVMLIWGIIED